jgi:hypothetical protein
VTAAAQFNRARAIVFALWRWEQRAAQRDGRGAVRFKHHIGFWRARIEIGTTYISTTYWAQYR